MMEDLLKPYNRSERYDVDMLDSILCSAVQAVAESVLGVYKLREARKKPDNCAKRLAKGLDMHSSIQLLKRAQHA